ncbi:T9SS type A sorting domain-containing protein [Chryseobacterium sp. ISL-6]|uniref:T9SS type A sorting domain-containing protein n=1 Tax=Chryseobacterium sp. ISL-6 TaxID=2819143 RepID=UPI001BE5852E|nr:T9SS type A sorting domain-containing protein [Chryseobacterium sp. ISL-6]MBT2620779.1 T9SS type A sorting domain-containing protein [Chryseobacterium sp. ISL-6]
MKKVLLTLTMALAASLGAQFSSGVVNLTTTGMTIKLDTTPSLVTMTLTGNDNAFMGIGFGSSGMASGADGFIYNSSANRDYTFNGVGVMPSADASQDWTVTTNTTSGGIRTVVATRSLSGGAGDTAIPNAAGTISIFYAKGNNTLNLSYHGGGNRDYATLNMAGTLGTGEVIAENKKIVLYPNPAKETVNFKNADRIKSIDIYETTGRKVRTVKLNGENISVSDLKSGTYYFEITSKDGTLSFEKLIKE